MQVSFYFIEKCMHAKKSLILLIEMTNNESIWINKLSVGRQNQEC